MESPAIFKTLAHVAGALDLVPTPIESCLLRDRLVTAIPASITKQAAYFAVL